jgi:hypothetical protein
VDECIAEDPYVVGTIGTAYVRGLQHAGVDATLKHFVGYSASRSGRNHAPVSAGPREVADVLLPPFEMAVRDGGARSVMNSYAEIDGVPVAASTAHLTELLRDAWGFEGVVVADYFSVLFLHTMHAIATVRVYVRNPAGDPVLQAVVSARRYYEQFEGEIRAPWTARIALGEEDRPKPIGDVELRIERGREVEKGEQRSVFGAGFERAVTLLVRTLIVPSLAFIAGERFWWPRKAVKA